MGWFSMGEKKSYLEQFKDFCIMRDMSFDVKYRPLVDRPHVGCWISGEYFSRNGNTIEDACKNALDWLNNYHFKERQESSTPHEDALRAWCKDMEYTFSNVNSCISIPELSLWCVHRYYSDDKEDACKIVLEKAKGVHERSCYELKDAFRDNPEVYWTIPISHEMHNSIGIQGTTPTKTISPCSSYPEACRKLIKAGKELLKDAASKTPHEDAFRAYCGEKGLLLEFAHACFSPIDILGELQVYYPKHLPVYTCQWGNSFDSVIRTKEDACEQALNSLKHNDELKVKQELEEFCRENEVTIEPHLDNNIRISNDLGYIIGNDYEVMLRGLKLSKFHKNRGSMFEDRDDIARRRLKNFCDEEGIRFVAMGPESVWVGGFGLSGHVFTSYQKAITRLEEMKANKEWKWEDKDRSELERFCAENGLTVSTKLSFRIRVTHNETNTFRFFSDSEHAFRALEFMKFSNEWIWSSGPYERKVRELCERKGWTLVNTSIDDICRGNWLIDIRELKSRGIYSCNKGEEGFKEVWDNIQKLKELLS